MCSLATTVFAQDIKKADPISASDILDSPKAVKLYTAKEISDIDTLVMRADAGIDELQQRTGTKLNCGVIVPEKIKANTRYTTQLLSVVEYNGEQYEEYCATVVTDYSNNSEYYWNDSEMSKEEKYNYRVTNRIYFSKNSDMTHVFYQRSMTVYETIGPVTATPVALDVFNEVVLDIVTYPGEYPQETYHVTKTFSNISANTPYILGSPYAGKIYSSVWTYLKTGATLRLNDGTKVECYCIYNP